MCRQMRCRTGDVEGVAPLSMQAAHSEDPRRRVLGLQEAGLQVGRPDGAFLSELLQFRLFTAILVGLLVSVVVYVPACSFQHSGGDRTSRPHTRPF